MKEEVDDKINTLFSGIEWVDVLIAVLIVPSVISILWMTALGGTAITMTVGGFEGIADAALELKLFQMLGQLPLTSITSFVGIILVIVFFVTSSDSGSLVIDTIAAGGKVNAPIPVQLRGSGGDRAAAGRRPDRLAGHGRLDRASLHHHPADRLLVDREGSDCRTARTCLNRRRQSQWRAGFSPPVLVLWSARCQNRC